MQADPEVLAGKKNRIDLGSGSTVSWAGSERTAFSRAVHEVAYVDPQIVELLGRNRLVNELLRAGLEVALPVRDRGIDLIAYADLRSSVGSFIARPIQMKAASESAFSIHRKYAKFPDLIIAFVWHLSRPEDEVTYALPYDDALRIGDALGWTRTASWLENDSYSTSSPSAQLLALLKPYEMDPDRWWFRVTGRERHAPFSA